jgi:hypothetical protein
MKNAPSDQVLEFHFEGEFLGFVGSPGKLKYLRLQVLTETVQIKIPKHLRLSAGLICQLGQPLRVSGIGKFDRETRELKFKAWQIEPGAAGSTGSAPIYPQPRRAKIKLLVCQKSGCLKRGGKKLYEAVGQLLRDRNLQDSITIESTGCLKRCSSAPNVMLSPGKQIFSGTSPHALARLDAALSSALQA